MRPVKYLSIVLLGTLLSSCSSKEKTSPVKKNIENAVFASGYIEQKNEYIVSASANGLIESLPVNEGDIVRTNDLIAVLKSNVQNTHLQDAQAVYHNALKNATDDSPQLLQLQAQISLASKQLHLDETNYKRYKDLRSKNSVSQLDFDKAELQYSTSKENLNVLEKRYKESKDALLLNADRSRIQVNTQLAVLDDYRLTADMAGKVINVYKKQGELVRSGESIARIGSGPYLTKLYVSEDDIAKIEPGQNVALRLNTYPNEIFTAKVSRILPAFNEKEQSYEVEATFDTFPEKMFSGTQLQANIQTTKRENVLVVPTAYLQEGKYLTLEDGSQREIVRGTSNKEWTEIISGITDKDIIVKIK